MATLATSTTLNKFIYQLQIAISLHQMRPFFAGLGPTADINAENNIKYPAIWVEPIESKSVNSIQGVRVDQLGLNVYCIDRIDKGDSNYQEILSDTRYILETLVGFIRESQMFRDEYIMIDTQDIIYTPVQRETDENCNGYRIRLLIRTPNTYNPCNSPFECPVTYVDPGYVDCFYVV